MSGILNRTVRMEERNNRYRSFDWNVVNTIVGGCWEPRNFPVSSRDISEAADTVLALDPDDMINKIDMVTFDVDRRDPFFRDPFTNMALMGGSLRYWIAHTFD